MSEINHILPEEVVRDKYGAWTHTAWPQDGEENALPVTWFAENGLSYAIIEFEHDAPEEIHEAYYDLGDPEQCAKWKPSNPDGDGWFIFSIHETDDGPVCVWVRPLQGLIRLNRDKAI